MDFLFAYIKVDQRYNHYYAEQNQSCGTRSAVFVIAERLVYVSDHRHKIALFGFRCAKYTDNARIFFEPAYKTRYYNVGYHRGEHRNGNSPESSYSACSVNFCRFVILLVNALKTSEQNKDFEGERVPYNIDN